MSREDCKKDWIRGNDKKWYDPEQLKKSEEVLYFLGMDDMQFRHFYESRKDALEKLIAEFSVIKKVPTIIHETDGIKNIMDDLSTVYSLLNILEKKLESLEIINDLKYKLRESCEQ